MSLRPGSFSPQIAPKTSSYTITDVIRMGHSGNVKQAKKIAEEIFNPTSDTKPTAKKSWPIIWILAGAVAVWWFFLRRK